MASFEPVVVLFGSSTSICTLNIRLPVSFLFAIDEKSLEELITIDPPLSSTYLKRYFIILLDSIDNNLLESLQQNHRIQAIYSRDNVKYVTNHSKMPQIMNKQLQQFTLDLTADIARFFEVEGEKQAKLERITLTSIYYRQARLLKEWAMSFAKAEPCHILLIPLNTSRENLSSAEERLKKISAQLSCSPVIIRRLDAYLPSTNEEHSCLLPYSERLFNNEDPTYICRLIERLSPLRLYLYGNDQVISSEWSSLMISREIEVMEDEDSWCAFIENESIDDEIKWNIGPTFGCNWNVKRIAPINLTNLDKSLRFQSALRRAFKTLIHRQNEITAEIFDWHDKCIREEYFHLEPNTSSIVGNKLERKTPCGLINSSKCRIVNASSFSYSRTSKSQGMAFIWLDEIINSVDSKLEKLIEPFEWQFFNDVSKCLLHIECQLRQHHEVFLVISGSVGYELFATAFRFMSAIRFIYVYCSMVSIHGNWTKYYRQIQGVFNDLEVLEEKFKQNLKEFHGCDNNQNINGQLPLKSNISYEEFYDQHIRSTPILVYNREQADIFMAHQRTIDTLLSLPYTDESRSEMIEECRRIYYDNKVVLDDINVFEQSYNSVSAIQWYSRDSFLFRIVNDALRSSNPERMFKMRYFLVDLYLQLDNLYKQAHNFSSSPRIEKFYRGQIMSNTEFEYFKQLPGHIISINTFLSTTESLQIALTFVNSSLDTNDFLRVIFCIETNPFVKHSRPYGHISFYSMFTDEDEVLFAMGSLFRVQYIGKLDRMNNIPVVYLQTVDEKDIDYNLIS